MFTVKQARLLAGKTQVETAEYLRVCRDTYRAIEQNPERATIKQAKEISRFFGLELDQIFFGENSTLNRNDFEFTRNAN